MMATNLGPYNKQHHHGGNVRRYSGTALANLLISPPETSAEGFGQRQRRCGRVLIKLTVPQRRKLNCTQKGLFVFIILPTESPPKRWINRPRRARPWLRLVLLQLDSSDSASFWLVVVCPIIKGGPLKANIFDFSSFLLLSLMTQTTGASLPTCSIPHMPTLKREG